VGRSCCQIGGGPALATRIPKELRVIILTIFGILCTIGVGLTLRRIPPLGNFLSIGREAFIIFNIYGHAFSLIAAASTVIRRRDRIILILAATVMWGIFVAEEMALEMVRFILFASLMTVGVRAGRRIIPKSVAGRVLLRAGLCALICGIGGLAYDGLGSLFGVPEFCLIGGLATALSWGLALGLAVGLGISLGSEVLEWMAKRAA
jgi:hypothetical protein